MFKPFLSVAIHSFCLSAIAGMLAACEGSWVGLNSSPSSPAASPIAATSIQPVAQPTSPALSTPQLDPYEQAISRASRAFALSQSAQSRDDWRLVAERWRQAVDYMGAVPAKSPRHAQAQQKLATYRRNLIYAQQQANRSTDLAHPNGVIVLAPQAIAAPVAPARPNLTTRPTAPSTGQPRVFSVPIVRRAGNTPVVNVTFNDSQTFQMIVDTGASGTLITRAMATALQVVPVAQANVDTASERNVTVPLGYVRSMQVGGVVAQEVLVAVAGPELSIGLLGHDFFGNYDITIRANEVEFRERN
jgi:predicted aspartyl protease